LCRRIFAGKFEKETAAAASAAVYFFCVYFSPETITAAEDVQKTIRKRSRPPRTIRNDHGRRRRGDLEPE
jgi:hypothetical protein